MIFCMISRVLGISKEILSIFSREIRLGYPVVFGPKIRNPPLNLKRLPPHTNYSFTQLFSPRSNVKPFLTRLLVASATRLKTLEFSVGGLLPICIFNRVLDIFLTLPKKPLVVLTAPQNYS